MSENSQKFQIAPGVVLFFTINWKNTAKKQKADTINIPPPSSWTKNKWDEFIEEILLLAKRDPHYVTQERCRLPGECQVDTSIRLTCRRGF